MQENLLYDHARVCLMLNYGGFIFDQIYRYFGKLAIVEESEINDVILNEGFYLIMAFAEHYAVKGKFADGRILVLHSLLNLERKHKQYV